jgi:hypothetical protein
LAKISRSTPRRSGDEGGGRLSRAGPRSFGGDEKSPADFLHLLEAISTHDGSAGWVASFGVSHMYLASLPAETLEKVYAEGPDVVFPAIFRRSRRCGSRAAIASRAAGPLAADRPVLR